MWIFTKNGFVSAVGHRDKPDTLLIRSRDKISLEGIADFAQVKIKRTPDADYLYRIEVSKTVFAVWMADQIEDIDYDNYKTKVHKVRGNDFADPLHDVWSVMLRVEDTGKYRDWGKLPEYEYSDWA
jgi:hypothetical protein